ncbi:hypothetical protein QWZ13_18400 [Reinekea marina]|nr:hypothetical protein [Reinekea marina]MDN3650883.1 hypothetical protein [Reinekea marina]
MILFRVLSIGSVMAAMATTTLASDCKWEETLTEIIEHQDQNSPYTTLVELNALMSKCPSTPRLYLEKGTMLYKLQRYNDAVDQWQYALDTYELPENVALKVKLKILDAQKKQKNQLRHLLLARVSFQSQSNEEQQYGILSLQGKSTFSFPAWELFKQPAYIETYTGYGGLMKQPLVQTPDSTSNTLLMFQVGSAINWQNLRLPVSLGLNYISKELSFNLSTSPRFKWKSIEASTGFDYELSEGTLELEPKVRWKGSELSIDVSATHQKLWQTLNVEASVGKKWNVEVAGEYDLIDAEHELSIALANRITSNLKLSVSANAVMSEPSYWETKAGLLWKIY